MPDRCAPAVAAPAQGLDTNAQLAEFGTHPARARQAAPLPRGHVRDWEDGHAGTRSRPHACRTRRRAIGARGRAGPGTGAPDRTAAELPRPGRRHHAGDHPHRTGHRRPVLHPVHRVAGRDHGAAGVRGRHHRGADARQHPGPVRQAPALGGGLLHLRQPRAEPAGRLHHLVDVRAVLAAVRRADLRLLRLHPGRAAQGALRHRRAVAVVGLHRGGRAHRRVPPVPRDQDLGPDGGGARRRRDAHRAGPGDHRVRQPRARRRLAGRLQFRQQDRPVRLRARRRPFRPGADRLGGGRAAGRGDARSQAERAPGR